MLEKFIERQIGMVKQRTSCYYLNGMCLPYLVPPVGQQCLQKPKAAIHICIQQSVFFLMQSRFFMQILCILA